MDPKWITVKLLREQLEYLDVLSNTKAVQRYLGINSTAMAIRQAAKEKIEEMEGLLGLNLTVTVHDKPIKPRIACLNCGLDAVKNPNCLLHAPELVCLDLRAKGIRDISEIKGLSEIPHLQYLILLDNHIQELRGLENLVDLEVLWLAGNQITQITGLDRLVNLRNLVLAKNKIEDTHGLSPLANLEILVLDQNHIKNIEGLERLSHLRKLGLGDNEISNIEGLDTLVNLEELSLAKNKITQIIGLGNLTKLERLFLHENPVFEWAKQEFGGVDENNEKNHYYPKNFLHVDRVVDYCKKE